MGSRSSGAMGVSIPKKACSRIWSRSMLSTASQQIPLQKAHDGTHLFGGALPVLRGEGVDREVFDTNILAIGGNAAECLRARPCGLPSGASPAWWPSGRCRPVMIAMWRGRRVACPVSSAFLVLHMRHLRSANSSFSFLAQEISSSSLQPVVGELLQVLFRAASSSSSVISEAFSSFLNVLHGIPADVPHGHLAVFRVLA